MQYRITYTYTNETTEAVLLADGHEVIAVGAENVARKEREIQDVGNSPWGLIQIVNPGETVSSTTLKNTESMNFDMPSFDNIFEEK
jgi:hypothetical protein